MERVLCYILLSLILLAPSVQQADGAIPLYWWKPHNETNFGDELARVIVERILGDEVTPPEEEERKLLAVGSILHFAQSGDVIWGAGINGKHPNFYEYPFTHLDIRSVRGPLTRGFLAKMGIDSPQIYGDPGLLIPHLFPEFQFDPKKDYVIIPHISEISLYEGEENVVLPTEPWDVVIQKIVESKFVISSSLHGLVVAEAFGIPAKWLRISENEPVFKYLDYYLGSGRLGVIPARSVDQAMEMGGEPPVNCDLQAILNAFPSDCFMLKPRFNEK